MCHSSAFIFHCYCDFTFEYVAVFSKIILVLIFFLLRMNERYKVYKKTIPQKETLLKERVAICSYSSGSLNCFLSDILFLSGMINRFKLVNDINF